jgi:hypothetical protein
MTGKHELEPVLPSDRVYTMAAVGETPEGLRRERVPYEFTLRALGAMLDERESVRIHVLEVINGFMMRYCLAPSDSALYTHRATHAELLELSAAVESRRHRKVFPFGFRLGQNARGTYEDALRALGSELDTMKAYSILIDETDEGFLVTYQYLNPAQGFMVRKRMAFLGREAISQARQEARSRRKEHSGGFRPDFTG